MIRQKYPSPLSPHICRGWMGWGIVLIVQQKSQRRELVPSVGDSFLQTKDRHRVQKFPQATLRPDLFFLPKASLQNALGARSACPVVYLNYLL